MNDDNNNNNNNNRRMRNHNNLNIKKKIIHVVCKLIKIIINIVK